MDNSTSTVGYTAVKQLLQIYGGVLLFVGIPANIITVIVFKQGSVTRSTTRALMMMLAVGDTAVLSTAVFRYWIRSIFSFDIRSVSRFACKGHAFSVGFFSDFAVGTLCVIAMERFLLVAFPHRANQLVNNRTVLIGVLCFVGLILIKNSALFWLFDLNAISVKNVTTFVCKGSRGMEAYVDAFTRLDFTTYSIMPYIILLTCNVSIFCKLRHQRRLMHSRTLATSTRVSEANGSHDTAAGKGPSKRKPESIVKVLTVLTIIHAITTLPGSTFILLKIYFRLAEDKTAEEMKQLHLLNDSLLMIVFTNNAVNFIAYMASSTPFRENFSKLFIDPWRKLVTPQSDKKTMALQENNQRRTLLGKPLIQTALTTKPEFDGEVQEPQRKEMSAEDGNTVAEDNRDHSATIPLVQVHNDNAP